MTYVVSVYCEVLRIVYRCTCISAILTIPVAMSLKERMKTSNERGMFRHKAKTRSPANTAGERWATTCIDNATYSPAHKNERM